MTSISKLVVAVFSSVVLVGCATAKKPEPTTQAEQSMDLLADLMSGGRLSAADVDVVAAKSQQYPLGSKENPVRVNMPQSQRAYLARLSCADGTKAACKRAGNFGPGPYGSIIDGYEITCSGQVQDDLIFMDMYYPNHREDETIPGYTFD